MQSEPVTDHIQNKWPLTPILYMKTITQQKHLICVHREIMKCIIVINFSVILTEIYVIST